jgi:pullulanase-type alpha-1,6-glucosidase
MKITAHIINPFIILMMVVTAFSASFVPSASAVEVTPTPETVVIPGTLQSELGCDADWMPSCEKTALTYDAEDDIWQGTFQVSPNDDQDKNGPRYKVALNGSWDENYGKNASRGGTDIPLVVEETSTVKFYYDHKTHWVTDSFNNPIVVAIGDFQTQLGCKKDNDASCLRSWLEDPEGSGAFNFTTSAIKKGTYSVALGFNEDSQNILDAPQSFNVANDGDEIYFGYDTVKKQLIISTAGAPKGSLTKLRAHWVNQDTLLWDIVGSPKYTYALFYSPDASLALASNGVQGGVEIPLTFSKAGPGGDVFQRNPYLAGYTAFKISPGDFDKIPEAVKSQLAIVARNEQGQVVDVTGIQIPGLLDALYTYSGPLGVTFEGSIPTMRLWAPTAQSVALQLFTDSDSQATDTQPMTRDKKTGVWSLTGTADWKNKYYLYEVNVYDPSVGKIVKNLVTDPYSISLSTNSQRSQIVDLTDPTLKPSTWDGVQKPQLAAPEDIVIYEQHIRDFSIHDQTVPENIRGTYKAFTIANSNGMKHLAALAQAGLTHIHLLPAFDIASVNEDKSTWQTVDENLLATYPPDSEQQTATVDKIKGADGFNWGYDPYHYTTPEGSYATDPNGTARILEFREMVQALNNNGLRVVMDVVYNHTSASGQNPKSVLDKIVPGYYYRLNTEGKVEKSTCCEDTATEHAMMQKLMVDSIITWATAYKVDGFRFDLMGFHMLDNMKDVRAALDALTIEKNGVDGKSIYIYGEGWDFGEVANNTRGINATQLNIGGTGIGVFNDRLRDGVRGGSPFTDPREQGFSTGLFLDPTSAETRESSTQEARLLEYMDWIRLGLAGNLREYKLIRADGNVVDGTHVLYNGISAGYTLDPQENIIYVSAHDNETIFDAIQNKAPTSAPLDDRIRMNNLALSIPMLSQGVPFFHAGDDILRSKSLDSNSYDSGDWFNKLDWTYETNNWGAGLPGQGRDRWEIFRPLLANPELKPTQAQIVGASGIFREFLQIRKGSPLFRLQTADEILRSLVFLNVGTDQIPGLIVMRLSDVDSIDPIYNDIVVVFNATNDTVNFKDGSLSDNAYTLHPVQQNSGDPITRTATFNASDGVFSVPGHTTAVFVVKDQIQPTLPPTVIATLQALPTATVIQSTNHSNTIELALIGFAILAIIGLVFYLTRRRLKQ